MTRSRSHVLILIVALVASGLLLVAPAQAAVARTLSISVSPNGNLAGKYVTFSGKASKTPKGINVKVQRKVGTKWVTVKTVKTKVGGGYAAAVQLPAKPAYYKYRTFSPAFEGLKAATSAVKTVAALRKTTFFQVGGNDFIMQSASAGESSAADGRVVNGTLGAKVVLQRNQGTGTPWVTVGTSTTQANGIFHVAFANAQTGSYRVVVSRKGLSSAATSKSQSYIFVTS